MDDERSEMERFKTGINCDQELGQDVLQTLRNKYKLCKTEEASTNDTGKAKKRSKNVEESKKIKNLDKPSKNKTGKSDDVTTIIDSNLVSKFGINISDLVQINFKLQTQVLPHIISWRFTDENMSNTPNQILLIMCWDELVNLVSTNCLVTHVQSVQEIFPNKNLYLGVWGFRNYFKYWKLKMGNEKVGKTYGEYENSIKITRQDLEFSLTELQLQCNCCHRFVESPEDISSLIIQFTKSIAKLPEKLEKQEKYKDAEWYMMKDNRDCVHVDKNGNGLQRLWQQQLTTFELVRLEVAEAIMSKYPTPTRLFNDYETCVSDGKKLLEDLPIRRAFGPLTSSRKIGPELSNKMYTFFNAVDGDTVL